MKIHTATLVLGLVGSAALNVALGADLKPTAPANVDLTGLWTINKDLSDDPHKVVAKKRTDSTGGGPMGGRSGSRRGGMVIDAGDILEGVFGGTVSGRTGGGAGGGASDRPAGDPVPSSTRMPLDSFLATLDEFEIAQKPDALTIATVEESNTCKPAEPGQAPLPGGELADRRCGWNGRTWVTELKGPDGETRTNRYELQKDGKQLVMVSEIKGGRTQQLSGLRIRRVYDRVVMN